MPEKGSTTGDGEGSINERLCFSGLTITITMPKKRQEKMMKKLVGSLGMVGDMLKDMVKRKQRAAMWTDRSFQDSLLHHSSQTKIAWPSRNRRASRAERKSTSGTVNEVNNEVTQARSRRVAFICNKAEK